MASWSSADVIVVDDSDNAEAIPDEANNNPNEREETNEAFRNAFNLFPKEHEAMTRQAKYAKAKSCCSCLMMGICLVSFCIFMPLVVLILTEVLSSSWFIIAATLGIISLFFFAVFLCKALQERKLKKLFDEKARLALPPDQDPLPEQGTRQSREAGLMRRIISLYQEYFPIAIRPVLPWPFSS